MPKKNNPGCKCCATNICAACMPLNPFPAGLYFTDSNYGSGSFIRTGSGWGTDWYCEIHPNAVGLMGNCLSGFVSGSSIAASIYYDLQCQQTPPLLILTIYLWTCVRSSQGKSWADYRFDGGTYYNWQAPTLASINNSGCSTIDVTFSYPAINASDFPVGTGYAYQGPLFMSSGTVNIHT